MIGRKFIQFTLAAITLAFFIYGCKSTPPPVPPEHVQLSQKQLKELSTVPKVDGADKLKNGQSAMLYSAYTQLNATLIGGTPATQLPAVKTIQAQQNRQFQNTLAGRQTGKIVGGSPVEEAQIAPNFRAQVGLVYTSFPDVPDGFFCAGSLINSTTILTAAHCLLALQPQDVKVYVGSYNLTGGGRLIDVAPNGLVMHEAYNGSDTYPLNDIALVMLAEPVTDIPPMPLLPTGSNGNLYPTNNAVISGWGQTVQGSGNGSVSLLYAQVTIIPFDTCQNSYGTLAPGMICATRPHTDTCQGDSGGPLTVFGRDGTLYEEGIVSWGIGCAQPKYPGVYVSTLYYISWIKSHTQLSQ